MAVFLLSTGLSGCSSDSGQASRTIHFLNAIALEDGTVLAVGSVTKGVARVPDYGIVARRSAGGEWSREPIETDADIFLAAAELSDGTLVVVGDDSRQGTEWGFGVEGGIVLYEKSPDADDWIAMTLSLEALPQEQADDIRQHGIRLNDVIESALGSCQALAVGGTTGQGYILERTVSNCNDPAQWIVRHHSDQTLWFNQALRLSNGEIVVAGAWGVIATRDAVGDWNEVDVGGETQGPDEGAYYSRVVERLNDVIVVGEGNGPPLLVGQKDFSGVWQFNEDPAYAVAFPDTHDFMDAAVLPGDVVILVGTVQSFVEGEEDGPIVFETDLSGIPWTSAGQVLVPTDLDGGVFANIPSWAVLATLSVNPSGVALAGGEYRDQTGRFKTLLLERTLNGIWSQLSSTSNEALLASAALNDGTVFVLGTNGLVIRKDPQDAVGEIHTESTRSLLP